MEGGEGSDLLIDPILEFLRCENSFNGCLTLQCSNRTRRKSALNGGKGGQELLRIVKALLIDSCGDTRTQAKFSQIRHLAGDKRQAAVRIDKIEPELGIVQCQRQVPQCHAVLAVIRGFPIVGSRDRGEGIVGVVLQSQTGNVRV